MTKPYDLDKDGFADISMVKQWHRQQQLQKVLPKIVVGTFGVGVGRNELLIDWVVSPRKDRRHGITEKPEPFSRHSKVSLDAMFKNW